MKTYFNFFLLIISFSLGFVLSEVINKKEIYIQIKEVPSNMYLKYSFSDNDSTSINQIDFGYNSRGIESWRLNINEKKIKKVDLTYLQKKSVCSQDWFTLNYSSFNRKESLLNNYKFFVVWKLNEEIYILPVINIQTVFYD